MICSAVIDRWVLNVDERYDFDVAAMFLEKYQSGVFFSFLLSRNTHTRPF